MSLDEIKELAGHRAVSPWVVKLVQEAVELEREACAKVVEEKTLRERTEFSRFMKDETIRPCRCATAIRARSN